MCGRTRCTVRVDEVGRACGFSAPLRNVDSDRFRPSYNVSPGRYMPVIRHAPAGGDPAVESAKSERVELVVHCMKWGLVPSFTKKGEKPDHFRMFNARSESVHAKSSFRRLLPKSRCVAAVEGFYEWKKDGPKKQPYYVHFDDGRPLVFAGLYDSWKDEEDNTLYTFTILTTRSSKALDWLHDRMPVILPNQDAIDSWMTGPLEEDSIRKLTQPYEAVDLVWHPVTTSMGKPSFDGPECIQEIRPKVASDSHIAQLFGKKQKDDSGVDHNMPNETAKATADEGDKKEYPLSEDDKIALLAAMEPDPDDKETLERVTSDIRSIPNESKPSSQAREDGSGKVSTQKDSLEDTDDVSKKGFSKSAVEFSPRKGALKDSPGAKKRRLSASPKLADKKVGVYAPSEKQSSLLSFFGKQ